MPGLCRRGSASRVVGAGDLPGTHLRIFPVLRAVKPLQRVAEDLAHRRQAVAAVDDSVWPTIIRACGESRKRTARAQVLGLQHPARRRVLAAHRAPSPRGSGSGRARRSRRRRRRPPLTRDPARGELDAEVADERLERRLRGADEHVVLERPERAERRDRDHRALPLLEQWRGRRWASSRNARALMSSVQSQCFAVTSSAGRTTPHAAFETSEVEPAEPLGRLVDDAGRGVGARPGGPCTSTARPPAASTRSAVSRAASSRRR